MATLPYFTLSCDFYKQNIFSGFTRLQEQQEFVDLTLAADGHIVKVHKNIMALASPYIKELLKSTSSDNPVIFLNNVRHNVLNYLLEYIYQGEVNVPQDSLEPLLQLSQSLQITGMAKHNTLENPIQEGCLNQNFEKNVQKHVQLYPTSTLQGTCNNNESASNIAACITINNDHNFEVQQFQNVPPVLVPNAERNDLKNSNTQMFTTEAIQAMPVIETFASVENLDSNMEMDVTLPQGDHNNATSEKEQINYPTIQIVSNTQNNPELALVDLNSLDKESIDALKMIKQYTTTERGAVQIIVSRYIYCSHHSSQRGRKHRWRCLEYRRGHCPAYIDSIDGQIVSRTGVHNHGFHDEKIYKKHENGQIFNSYHQAQEAWTKKDNGLYQDTES